METIRFRKAHLLVSATTFLLGVSFSSLVAPVPVSIALNEDAEGTLVETHQARTRVKSCKPGDFAVAIDEELADLELERLEVLRDLENAKSRTERRGLELRAEQLRLTIVYLEAEREMYRAKRYRDDGTTHLLYRELCYEN